MRWTIRVLVWRWWWVAAGLLVVMPFILRLMAPALFDFLAVTDPECGGRPADWVVVEGWIPDHAVSEVVESIRRHTIPVVTTGGPLERGAFLSSYHTYAELARATLLAAGVPSQRVTAVPAPRARRDRTWTSALALREFFLVHGISSGMVALVTQDVHARRSRFLFARALGEGFRVRSCPYGNPWYGRNDWWESSEGFRAVIGEWLAWVHTWLAPPALESLCDRVTLESNVHLSQSAADSQNDDGMEREGRRRTGAGGPGASP